MESSKPSHEEIILSKYLDSFFQNDNQCQDINNIDIYTRAQCCGSSKSLYCTDCDKLLVPKSFWPKSIRDGNLKLPFDLDIILQDRKRSSTGYHSVVLLNASKLQNSHQSENNESLPSHNSLVTLIDLDSQQTIPNYDNSNGTFLLFPTNDSVPISSVASRISKLVVLDCKWTRTKRIEKLPQIQSMQKVHIDNPPLQSYFWRWHNAGDGMLSTLEAIYFSAVTVLSSSSSNKNIPINETNDNCTTSTTSILPKEIKDERFDYDSIIDIMWLFGLQRAATSATVEREGRPLPFTQEGKELQRAFRRRQVIEDGTSSIKKDDLSHENDGIDSQERDPVSNDQLIHNEECCNSDSKRKRIKG